MIVSEKLALVTGAGRGIGKAISQRLLSDGYTVVAVSRTISSDPDLEQAANEAQTRFIPIQADVSLDADHDRLFHRINEEFGKLDVLVHNAGVAPLQRTDLLSMSAESYERVMRINLTGPVFLTKRLFPLLEKVNKPCLIFITSMSAEVVSVNRVEYGMSKAALSHYARALAHRQADSSCRVYEIRPGIVDTDMIEPVRERYTQLAGEGGIPQKRLGRPADIAMAVHSLVSGHFDYANGMVLEISGGMHIRYL